MQTVGMKSIPEAGQDPKSEAESKSMTQMTHRVINPTTIDTAILEEKRRASNGTVFAETEYTGKVGGDSSPMRLRHVFGDRASSNIEVSDSNATIAAGFGH